MEKIIAYHEKIGSLFEELMDSYNQVLKLSEINVTGTLKIKSFSNWVTKERTANFAEQMELIRIYLKKLSEEQLSNEEEILFNSSDLINGLVWDSMADFMEPLIQWLKNIIKFVLLSL